MSKELIKNFLKFKSSIVDCAAELLPPAVRDAVDRFRREVLEGLEEFVKEEQAKRAEETKKSGVKPVTID